MGYSLIDRETGEEIFRTNFWHWGAISAAISATGTAPPPFAGDIEWDQPWVIGNGLDRDQSLRVAAALRRLVLPHLAPGTWLKADGTITAEEGASELFRTPEGWWRNYATNREVVEDFVVALERCNGFKIG